MMLRSIREDDGFTIAELLVFVGIMVIFLIGVGGMITSGAKSSTASYNLVKMSEGANEALSTMVRQIRVATVLDASCSAGAIAFTGDVDGNGSEDSVRFDAAGGYLRRGSSADSMSDWVPSVDSVTFSYNYFDPADKTVKAFDPISQTWADYRTGIVRVDIVLQMSEPSMGITLSRTYRGSVNLRNELRAN
jgi:type II secretory pathway component PulJ